MIGLDTNVLVRYIAQDDPKQSPRANRLIEGLTAEEPGFISVVALVELVWVLAACYHLKRDQLAQAIEGVLRAKEFVVDRAGEVAQALRLFRAGSADFADCLIARTGSSAGCSATFTFDAGAAKSAGMSLVP